MDRRRKATKNEFDDGNGKKVIVTSTSYGALTRVLAVICSLIVIATTAFAAARFGVQVGVRDEIQNQIRDSKSPLTMHIQEVHNDSCKENNEKVANKLEALSVDVGSLKTGQEDLKAHIEGINQYLRGKK